MKNVHLFLANFMINFGSQDLVAATNKIQNEILFMVLDSECDKIKFVQSPARDKKYVCVAYARLMGEYSNQMGVEKVKKLVGALLD
jgi:hypothetical protein